MEVTPQGVRGASGSTGDLGSSTCLLKVDSVQSPDPWLHKRPLPSTLLAHVWYSPVTWTICELPSLPAPQL